MQYVCFSSLFIPSIFPPIVVKYAFSTLYFEYFVSSTFLHSYIPKLSTALPIFKASLGSPDQLVHIKFKFTF